MKQIVQTVTISILLALMLCACRQTQHQTAGSSSKLDSLFYLIYDNRYSNPQRSLFLIDSLAETKDLTQNMCDECRAEVYDAMGQSRAAAFYAEKSLKDGQLKEEDLPSFYAAYRLLSHIYINNLNWKKALDFATEGLHYANEGLAQSDQMRYRMAKQYKPKFLSQIGSCQIMLGHEKEGNQNYRMAYDELYEITKEKNDFTSYYNLFAIIANCIECNLMKDNIDEALTWLPKLEESYNQSKAVKDAKEEYDTYARQCLEANEALVLAKAGKLKEAEAHYRTFKSLLQDGDNDFLGTQVGYLSTVGRWQELADLSETIDEARQDDNKDLSMDYLRLELAPMFKAEVKSHRSAKALQTAERIINVLDSVYTKTQDEDAAQLAVIYETQEKESKIAEQETELSLQRLVGIAIALGLLTVFFLVYALYRRRSQKRLAKAHSQLQEAYGQLEETTMAKERIESELRIARDIQMSMVPHVFPQREGLDLYAAMMPAKEVGGDLYGYQLEGDRLYFCVGDVSGKGVPASLFMAQATRLFSTLSSQQMMPAEICTRINKALSGDDNEQGMFVTMFVGLVDLTTGRLDFCNAGHNPPVLGGDAAHGSFLEMQANAPIGLWPDLEFEGESIDSIRGKVLFIYTDGLNEAENPAQKQFGDERMLALLRHTDYESARQVIDTLAREVERHRNGADANDDLTMMCLRMK